MDYPKEIVINSGVELGATSTSEEALEVETGLAGGLTITNNGTLTGAGGAAGADGGDAFEAAATCTFVNNGTVRAGGGGGGSGGSGGRGRQTSTTYYGASEYAGYSGCQGKAGSCCGVIQYYGWGKRCYCCSSSTSYYNGGSGGGGGVGLDTIKLPVQALAALGAALTLALVGQAAVAAISVLAVLVEIQAVMAITQTAHLVVVAVQPVSICAAHRL